MTNEYDCVVIGGGLSGLSAAKLLRDQGKNVVVLEARERVGGRTCTEYTNINGKEVYADMGGAYVGPGQLRVMRVANNYGIKTYRIRDKGKRPVIIEGKKSWETGDIPNMGILEVLQMNRALVHVDDICKKHINIEAIWKSKHAEVYDNMTVRDYCEQFNLSPPSTSLTQTAIENVTCVPFEETSLLYMLQICASGGSFNRVIKVSDGAQERKFIGGSMQLSDAIANNLGETKVLRNHQVVEILQIGEDETRIVCKNGTKLAAKSVIVALSPSLYKAIKFNPPLPKSKEDFANSMEMGTIIKTVTFYETAWWRKAGLSGQLINDKGPIWFSLDDTKADDTFPSIMGFCLSSHCKEWMQKPVEERKQAILKQYAMQFESDEALHPVAYMEKNWNDEEFSKGCYSAVPSVGAIYKHGSAARIPFKRVHFAGTELATEWVGYMDGAIQSGERAALEVLEVLEPKKKYELPDSPIPTDMPIRDVGPYWYERILASISSFFAKHNNMPKL